MTLISDGKLELEFKQNKSELKVTLGADKYRLTELAEYKLFLSGDEHYLPGKVLKANEDQLTLSYQLPEKALALTEYVKRFDRQSYVYCPNFIGSLTNKRGCYNLLLSLRTFLLSGNGSLSHTGGSSLRWRRSKKQPNLESSNFGRWSYIYLNLSKIMPS